MVKDKRDSQGCQQGVGNKLILLCPRRAGRLLSETALNPGRETLTSRARVSLTVHRSAFTALWRTALDREALSCDAG